MLSAIFEIAPNTDNDESEHEYLFRRTVRAYLNVRLAIDEQLDQTSNNARPKRRPTREAVASALRKWRSQEP